ncbi:hypothetical protein [Actinomyces bowdenii]|uniref:hypothetical protein n=1 Tax=Actinomyces bowdenii TaxID=131109 RepID=UPI00163954F6|nr:hypothetical protein [Actinomyces bowdenii]
MDEDMLSRIRGCYGAVRVRDLSPDRTERRRLAGLIEEGLLDAHLHGVVSIPGTETAIILARIHGGVMTCQSAAEYYGLPLPSGTHHIHLSVPPGWRMPIIGNEVVHIERSLPPPSPTEFPVAPLARALSRYLRCSSDAAAPIMACDAALHAEQVSLQQVADLLHGPGSVEARRRLRRTSSRCRSPLESLARRQLEDAGMAVEVGVDMSDIGEVDLVVDGSLVIELDGYQFHSDRRQFARDRWRDRELMKRGIPVARFTRADVLAGRVAREVPALLRGSAVSGSLTNTPSMPPQPHERPAIPTLMKSRSGNDPPFVRNPDTTGPR